MNHRGGRPAFRLGPQLDERTEQVAREIVDAAYEVHRQLGAGYAENMYESALSIELTSRGMPYLRQHAFSVQYRGQAIGEGRLDLLVDNRVIVELKAVEKLLPVHEAQLLSYLKATQHRLGFLVNFNVPALKEGIKRMVF